MTDDDELMSETRALIERAKAGDKQARSLLWAGIDGPIQAGSPGTDCLSDCRPFPAPGVRLRC